MLRQFRQTGGYDLQKMKLINTLQRRRFLPSKKTSQGKKVNIPNFTDFFTVLRIKYALKTQYQHLKRIENIRLLQY